MVRPSNAKNPSHGRTYCPSRSDRLLHPLLLLLLLPPLQMSSSTLFAPFPRMKPSLSCSISEVKRAWMILHSLLPDERASAKTLLGFLSALQSPVRFDHPALIFREMYFPALHPHPQSPRVNACGTTRRLSFQGHVRAPIPGSVPHRTTTL